MKQKADGDLGRREIEILDKRTEDFAAASSGVGSKDEHDVDVPWSGLADVLEHLVDFVQGKVVRVPELADFGLREATARDLPLDLLPGVKRRLALHSIPVNDALSRRRDGDQALGQRPLVAD